MVVDLPAPLSPSRAKIDPVGTCKAQAIKGAFAGIGLGYLVKLDGWIHGWAS